jgi:ABC-type nitrate/sulfonate/bicarbonate transport system substrate-binding protein
MKRLAVSVAMVAMLMLGLAGCAPSTPAKRTTPAKPSAGSANTSSGLAPGQASTPFVKVNKDTMYLTPTKKTYDASQFLQTAMTGAPSNIPFFKPVKDEGTVNRVYPSTDSKTFKFLTDMNQCLVPQWYYLFDKNGGTLNAAVSSTSYKFEGIMDSGAVKLVPNMMLGYYDFAYIPFNTLSTYWSGNEPQYQELWRAGDDYVVVGASYRGGSDLLAPGSVTSAKQLAGTTVGIPAPDYSNETMLNKWLSTAGLATASAGGNVQVELATPGFIMNDLIAKKDSAAFVYGKYAAQLKAQYGFKTLVSWQNMGYGTQRSLMLLIVRKDIIANHPDIVQAVVQANYDATKQAVSAGDWRTPSDAAFNAYWEKYYATTQHIQDPTAALINAQASPTFLHAVIDYMTKCGYFKIPYTYNDLVNETFYNNVKK